MPQTTKRYTGRYRFRAQNRWLRSPLMVLQLEWNYKGIDLINSRDRVEDKPFDFTIYEDAKLIDMQLFWKGKDDDELI